MKKFLKRIGKIVVIVLAIVIVILFVLKIYHGIMLKLEANKIQPNGSMVEVNGHEMHVYSEGKKNDKPTLVFMSGSATVAPVYNFKSLYSLLSDRYHIVVVEKAGYGHSEICEVERDIDTMLEETREALDFAGETGPYVLLPHSMSGIEAIYWAQQYPEEISSIIGLDMAVPESYEYFDFASVNQQMNAGRATVWFGIHRIPGAYALDTTSLTKEEIQQQKLLMYKNAVNIDYMLEAKTIYRNAMKVKENGDITSTPMLLFVSDGTEIGDFWISCQEQFAEENKAELIQLNCGHYVHNSEYGYISEVVGTYVNELSLKR